MTLLPRRALAGLAISASLAGCSHEPPAISVANAAAAQTVGARLAAQDRANETAHRATLAKLMRVSVQHVEEKDRTMQIVLNVRNLSTKSVRRMDLGFIAETPLGQDLAMTELHTAANIAPNATRIVVLTIPYTQFGDDTGRMREAAGTKHHFVADVKEIKYTDGSDAGFDD